MSAALEIQTKRNLEFLQKVLVGGFGSGCEWGRGEERKGGTPARSAWML